MTPSSRPESRPTSLRVAFIAAACAALASAAFAAAPATAAELAYVPNADSNTVSVFDSKSLVSAAPIPVGTSPVAVAFSPEGSRAYVANNLGAGDLSVINTTTGSVVSTVAIAGLPEAVAVSPDGSTVAVTSENGSDEALSFYSTATNTVSAPLTIPAIGIAGDVVFSADGKYAFVLDYDDGIIITVDVAANAIVSQVPSSCTFASRIALSPNGSTLAVICTGSVKLFSAQQTPVAGPALALDIDGLGVEFAPDGSSLYVSGIGNVAGEGVVKRLDPATLALQTSSPSPPLAAKVSAIGITPDASRALALQTTADPGSVAGLAVPGLTPEGAAVGVGLDPRGIAVSPAQAPTAAFSAAAGNNRGEIDFDASASSDSDGSIVSYRWDFGDGTSKTTTTPKTSRNYQSLAQFTVKLTVTDSQGVSTTKTTNGHQVVRNGASSADVSHAVTVKAKPLNTKAPTITGLFAVGQRITGNPGDWAGTSPISFKYQWLRCNTAGASCVSISGATARTRTISKNDQKHRLRIKATATNSVGSASENSAAGTTVASALKFSFSLKAASPQNFKRSRYRLYETATCKVEACRIASTVTVRRPLSRAQRRRHTRLKLLTWRTNSTVVNKNSARSVGIIVPTRYRTAIKRSLRGRARARVSIVTKATTSTHKSSTRAVTFALKR